MYADVHLIVRCVFCLYCCLLDFVSTAVCACFWHGTFDRCCCCCCMQNGEWLPGAKGLNMSFDQWKKLLDGRDAIDSKLK